MMHIPTAINKILDKDLKMRFINDAACFAIGESVKGEGENFKKGVVITLNTEIEHSRTGTNDSNIR